MNAVTPYDYIPSVLAVLELISQGHTRTSACDQRNVPIPVFEKYTNEVPELRDLLVEAERRGHDALADSLVVMFSPVLPSGNKNPFVQTDPRNAKILSENIKWLLEKRDSKRFGQKTTVEHNVKLDRTILEQLHLGKQRAADAVRTIEHVPLKEIAPPVFDALVLDTTFTDEDIETMQELLS